MAELSQKPSLSLRSKRLMRAALAAHLLMVSGIHMFSRGLPRSFNAAPPPVRGRV